VPWILCEVCKEEEFRSAKAQCSYCAGIVERSTLDAPEFSGDSDIKPKPAINNISKRTKGPATLDDVVAAQNRTTHAIRAFVRFLFIQLSSTTAAYFIYLQADSQAAKLECVRDGSCGASIFLYFVALIVWLGGVVISSQAGWSELEKSEVPE
jgi:hypothetical protein